MCLQGAIINKLSSLTGLSWGKKPQLFLHMTFTNLEETFTNLIDWAILKTWGTGLFVQKSKPQALVYHLGKLF